VIRIQKPIENLRKAFKVALIYSIHYNYTIEDR